MNKFSKRLRQLRSNKEMKQSDIAEILGVSMQSYSAYENGREPNYDTLIQIAKLFDVSSDYLLGLTDAKTRDIDIQAMCEKTGLSEKGINSLINCPYNDTNCIDYLITDNFFNELVRIIRLIILYKVDEKSYSYLKDFTDVIRVEDIDILRNVNNAKKLKNDLIENFSDKVCLITEGGAIDFEIFKAQNEFTEFLYNVVRNRIRQNKKEPESNPKCN